MSDAERKRTFAAIDGPARQERKEQPKEYVPLPTARRGGGGLKVSVRVVKGA
ncbi:hypothetical protein [Streptomyces malaysiensis]|uniref:hypothetical protein n=1 Tax=Streptomyces malaysiensis TaxID=92644 RepID=UPI003688CD5D